MYTHIDDSIVYSSDAAVTRAAIDDFATDMTEVGFVVGSVEYGSDLDNFIGYQPTEEGIIRLSPQRLNLIWEAISFLIGCHTVSVDAVANVVGVLTWAFLLRRPLLSILFDSYRFCRSFRGQVRRLWKSVRHELRHARNMLAFAQVDVTRPVFPYVLCQDAQGASKRDAGGAGLVFGRPPQTEVLRAALSTEPGGRGRIVGPEMVALGCDHLAGLPPASPWNEAWQTTRWYDTLAVDWKYKDHIHLGEARALNLWLEIASRLPLVRGTRIVDLCDSQSATHAFAKGRSHAFALNQLLR